MVHVDGVIALQAGVALGYMAQEWAHGPYTAKEIIRKTVNR